MYKIQFENCVAVAVTVKVDGDLILGYTAPAEAPDGQYYGLVGIIMICLEIGVMVLLDIITLGRDIKLFIRNVRHCCKTIKVRIMSNLARIM